MIFEPKSTDRMITEKFPPFTLNGCSLSFVQQIKYLGHIVSSTLNDDEDIKREIGNLFMRTNMHISRYCKCSTNVKLTLFRSYCMSLYDISIWKHFTVTALNKFRSCYNKCVKKFFGYSRYDSMSGVLLLLNLPSAHTVVHNSHSLFVQQCAMSCNSIVQWLEVIGV